MKIAEANTVPVADTRGGLLKSSEGACPQAPSIFHKVSATVLYPHLMYAK